MTASYCSSEHLNLAAERRRFSFELAQQIRAAAETTALLDGGLDSCLRLRFEDHVERRLRRPTELSETSLRGHVAEPFFTGLCAQRHPDFL
jgi:hypothetical protein